MLLRCAGSDAQYESNIRRRRLRCPCWNIASLQFTEPRTGLLLHLGLRPQRKKLCVGVCVWCLCVRHVCFCVFDLATCVCASSAQSARHQQQKAVRQRLHVSAPHPWKSMNATMLKGQLFHSVLLCCWVILGFVCVCVSVCCVCEERDGRKDVCMS